MIYLGLRNTEKQKIIIDYIRQNDIRHVAKSADRLVRNLSGHPPEHSIWILKRLEEIQSWKSSRISTGQMLQIPYQTGRLNSSDGQKVLCTVYFTICSAGSITAI